MARAVDEPRRDRSWPAKYRGECAECDGSIEPGELVHYVRDDLRHVDCPEWDDDFEVSAPPCLRCFTVPSAAGTCLCD